MKKKPRQLLKAPTRELKGVTLARFFMQLSVSDAARLVGVSQPTWTYYEQYPKPMPAHKALAIMKNLGYKSTHVTDDPHILLHKLTIQACLMFPEFEYYEGVRHVLRHYPDILKQLLRDRPDDIKREKGKISTTVDPTAPGIIRKPLHYPKNWPLSEDEYKVHVKAKAEKSAKSKIIAHALRKKMHDDAKAEAEARGEKNDEPEPIFSLGGKPHLVKRDKPVAKKPSPLPDCPRDAFGQPGTSFICRKCNTRLKAACRKVVQNG